MKKWHLKELMERIESLKFHNELAWTLATDEGEVEIGEALGSLNCDICEVIGLVDDRLSEAEEKVKE